MNRLRIEKPPRTLAETEVLLVQAVAALRLFHQAMKMASGYPDTGWEREKLRKAWEAGQAVLNQADEE